MKKLTIIATGLLVTASGLAAATIHLPRTPLDHAAPVAERVRVRNIPADKEDFQAPRTMLGLPRKP